MRYKSIVRLFEYCGIDGSKLDVGKIRKIISAEFALVESGIISIDGLDYSKNDALAEIESPDFVNRYRHHEVIRNDRTLLDCLERNTVTLSDFFPRLSLSANPDFVRFISPYFASSFDKIMRKYLRAFDYRSASEWMATLCFIDTAEDTERALQGTRLYFLEFIKRLKNANTVTYVRMIRELKAWRKDTHSSMLVNCLMPIIPDIMSDLMRALINFTVTIQFADKFLCYRISCHLLAIKNLDADRAALIRENHRVYRSKMFFLNKREQLEKKIKKNRDKYIRIVLLLYFVSHISFFDGINSYVAYKHTEIFREFVRNTDNRTDFIYTDDENLETSGTPADSVQFPDPNKNYEIDLELFGKLRHRYSVLETSKLDYSPQIYNVGKTQLCYMRFHRFRDGTMMHPIIIDLENKTADSVMLYIDVGKSSPVSMVLEPGRKLKLERTYNRFEILVNPRASKTPATRSGTFLGFTVRSFFVCDEQTVLRYMFNPYPGVGVLNIDTDSPDDETDFNIVFLPGYKKNDIRLSFSTGYVSELKMMKYELPTVGNSKGYKKLP